MTDHLPMRPDDALPAPSHYVNGRSARPAVEPPAEEPGADLQSVLASLRRNIGLILVCALVAGAASAYVIFKAKPQFAAVATLRLMDERQMLTGGIETGVGETMLGRSADPLQSQMQVLRSRSVLGQVVDAVGLRMIPIEGELPRRLVTSVVTPVEAEMDTVRLTFGADGYVLEQGSTRSTAAYGAAAQVPVLSIVVAERPAAREPVTMIVNSRDRAIDRLTADLRARPRVNTDLVDLEYASSDPVLSQLVVNTTAQVFRERSQAAAQDQSRRRREFVEARLVETERLLGDAQQAVSDFQRREQVFSSRDKFAAQQIAMSSMETRHEELMSQRRIFASLLASLNRGTSTQALRAVVATPGLTQNPVITELYGQLARYEVVRDSMRVVGASETNPDFQRVSSLIRRTQDELVSAVQSQIIGMDAQLSAIQEVRRRQASELASMPGVQAEEARLVLEFETVRQLADQLREEAQRARIAEAVEAGQVEIIDLAPMPRPVPQRKPLKLAVGLLLGLMTGSGLALLREHMNTAIRSREDSEQELQTPTLAVIPRIELAGDPGGWKGLLRRGNGRSTAVVTSAALNPAIVTVVDTHSSSAEAFRSLRTNLIFSQSANGIRNLVVTSSLAGEGKSTTATNLAASYAQQGLRVLLVDADLRRPRLHQSFGLSKEQGLSELIIGHLKLDDVTKPTRVENLFVVTSGVQPPNPTELMGGPRMRAAVAQMLERFDLVIFDTPPVLAAAEGVILGTRADAVVLVVRAGKTDRQSAQYALHQLRSLNANVVGVVLNDMDEQVPKYSRYAYYYTYYGADEKQRS